MNAPPPAELQLIAASLEEVVRAAWRTPGLVTEYDRLYGTSLAKRAELEADEEAYGFIGFVAQYIWAPTLRRELEGS